MLRGKCFEYSESEFSLRVSGGSYPRLRVGVTTMAATFRCHYIDRVK